MKEKKTTSAAHETDVLYIVCAHSSWLNKNLLRKQNLLTFCFSLFPQSCSSTAVSLELLILNDHNFVSPPPPVLLLFPPFFLLFFFFHLLPSSSFFFFSSLVFLSSSSFLSSPLSPLFFFLVLVLLLQNIQKLQYVLTITWA